MNDVKRVIAAGGSESFDGLFNFVHLAESTGRVKITFSDGSTALMDQGDQMRPDTALDSFTVTNPDALVPVTVRFVYGKGEFRQGQLVGVISSITGITNPVTVETAAGSPVTVETAAGSTLSVSDTTVRTLSFTSTWEVLSSVSTALETIVAPAANINGVRLDGFHFVSYSGIYARLMAKTSAPAAWNDMTASTLALGVMPGSGNGAGFVIADWPVIIPAGFGVYFQVSSSSVDHSAALNFEVL